VGRPTLRPNDVFINIPFDSAHERTFLAYVSALTSLGLRPRCVLEVSPDKDRLRRLVSLMSECAYSIHDLSHVTLSRSPHRVPRFNMPFELGMCASLSIELRHRFRVFEEIPHRLGQSLSDLQGYEPFIHHGTVHGVICATLDAFEHLASKVLDNERDILWVYRRLRRFRLEEVGGDVFRPRAFRRLSAAAVRLVEEKRESLA
jgi:hypothetical protein